MSEHIYKLLKHHHNHHDHHPGTSIVNITSLSSRSKLPCDTWRFSPQQSGSRPQRLHSVSADDCNYKYIIFVSFTLGLKMESLNCCYMVGCCNTKSCLDCKILCWNKVIFNFWSQYTSQKCKTNLRKKSEFKLVFFIQQRTCNVIDMLSYWRCFDKCETRNFILITKC